MKTEKRYPSLTTNESNDVVFKEPLIKSNLRMRISYGPFGIHIVACVPRAIIKPYDDGLMTDLVL